MIDASRTDGELLAEFARSGNEEAFEEVVRRHGTLVLSTCRRLLVPGDEEDAAQACFLTLARKAASLGGRPSVAGWLHRVALNVARRARQAAALRAAREKEAELMAARNSPAGTSTQWAAVGPLLDGELDALPDRLRVPLVLHHLEGRSEAEAAQLLGWKLGTFSSRLARARETLRDRLARRGAVLSVGLLAALVTENAASAELPAALAARFARAAALLAAGDAAAAAMVSARVAALTKGVLKAMLITKLKQAAAGLAVCAALCCTALVTYRTIAAERVPAPSERPAPPPPSSGPAPSAADPAPAPPADPEPKPPGQVASECFPDDGVLLVVSLDAVNRVSFGPVTGCRLRLKLEEILRLERGRRKIETPNNPFTLEQTLMLLGQRKGEKNLVLQVGRQRMKNDTLGGAAAAYDARLETRLKAGGRFLLVMPSALQLSPIPALPIPGGSMPWCQFPGGPEKGMILVDYDAERMRGLPEQLKQVRECLAELGAADRAARLAAVAGLLKHRELAEPLVHLELAGAREDRRLRLGLGLALARLGGAAAPAALAPALAGEDPLACHDAITALAGVKGYTLSELKLLVARLDDTRPRSAGELTYSLSESATRTLEAVTGLKFGADEAKWSAWLEEQEKELNRPAPSGTYGKGGVQRG
jgi:RNA polymerase sigma factor (sigma-70 family)